VIIKALKLLAKIVGGVLLVLIVSGLSYRWYVQRQITDERAIRSSGGVDILESVRIGGIDQWIHIRGENANNPVLLFIHGGPGIGFIALAGTFQRPWEKYFTVVQWDQRGAGKTYARNDRELQRRTMSVARMQQDALEVANYLRTRFTRDTIIVVGASWGTVLGLWLAHEHPDVVAAYVGVGQFVDAKQNEQMAYDDALAMARAQHRADAIGALEGLRPFPSPTLDLRKGSIAQTWEARLLGPPADRPQFIDVPRLLSTLLTAPEYSLGDVYGFTRAQIFSLETLIPEVRNMDLTTLGTDFRVPVLFFQGRHDPYVRPALVEKYAATITAPARELVWFENAGHFPFFEDPQMFTDELVKRLLPRRVLGGRGFGLPRRREDL
jgi:pimeloyl-ACP methyl ester carboxylesterase